MGVMTYGSYVIYDTTAPTSAWDPSGHTEGTDYLKFQNSPKRGWNVEIKDEVDSSGGGFQYCISIGEFAEQYTIDDVATEAELDNIEKFFKWRYQPASAAYLYLVVVKVDGNPPTVKNWYQNSSSTSAYLPIRFGGINATWDENSQINKVRITLEACWT